MSFNSLARSSALLASVAIVAIAPAHGAQAQTRSFNLHAQPAATGVSGFARQADVQILISAHDAEGRRTNAVVGPYSVAQGLDRLLAGTGLRYRETGPKTFSVSADQVSADEPVTFLPEILVHSDRNWSLNTDIRRSEDDAQPYVVFTAEDIARSGSASLDQFFRDNLGAATGAAVAETSGLNRGRTQINLRGLGADQTLILVDGRRLPNVNTGSGFLEQPTIQGIPMAQIERIEILPSSASSVYGGGATGGVINIVLKRDYRGVDFTATYADVVDGDAPDRRIDLSSGFNLEGGRTNVSLSLNWRDTDPLLSEDRDFLQRGRAFLAQNNPSYLASNVLLGATPNIRSANGAILTFDPAFGGGSLGARFTHLPYGYRGVALDGIAPLQANAGTYNLDLAPTAGAGGGRVPLTLGQDSLSASIAVRREFTSWLRLYGEAQAQRTDASSNFSRVAPIVTLAANAPNNPFQQSIMVAVPHAGVDAEALSRSETRRFLGGAIVELPFNWQANLDYTRNWSRFSSVDSYASPTAATLTGMANGTLDVMRDLSIAPLTYAFLDEESGQRRSPSRSTTETATFRLAGPLPVRLPGGRPAITFVAERSKLWLDDSLGITNQASQSTITYTPSRSQTTDSAYLEMRAPILGPANGVPFVHSLEFQVSARYDGYEGYGAATSITCLSVPRPLTSEEVSGASSRCPPSGVTPAYATASRSHVDPTYALRWQPTPDVTFRTSWGTGYLPPYLHQLVKLRTPLLSVSIADPLRGNEPVGTALFPGFYVLNNVNNFTGGNPDVKPETSETFSAGVIITPRIVPNLRLSIDWTDIQKDDVYFSPATLLNTAINGADTQGMFNEFMALYPERFGRGPASGGYAVGPITSIDASYANLSMARVKTVDFTIDYSRTLGRGELQLSASGTFLKALSVQLAEASQIQEWSGVATGIFQGLGGAGGVKWKANAQVRWSTETLTVGWRARFFDDYWLTRSHSPDPVQLTARIPSQIYHDVFASYALRDDIDIRAGVNNVLNRRPPLDLTTSTYYSRFGDPRRANFYLTVNKRF